MTKIKANPQPANIYNQFITDLVTSESTQGPSTHYDFSWEFNNTVDTINVKLINTTENKIEYNFSIPYDNIKVNPAYDTQTYFAIKNSAVETFMLSLNGEGEYSPTTQEQRNTPYVISADELTEITSFTLPTKAILDTGNTQMYSPDQLKSAHGSNEAMFKIIVPYKDCPVSDLEFVVKYPDTPEVTVTYGPDADVTTLENTVAGEGSAASKYFNKLTITADKDAPAAGDNIKLTVTSEDPNVPEVYAEAVVGILTKTTIKLTDGVGNVTVSTLGLDSGDQVLIKFGYKYFTNIANYTKTLA